MKQQIDALIVASNKMQQFLIWVEGKCDLVKASYEPAAVRSFYLALAFDLDLDLSKRFNLSLNINLRQGVSFGIDISHSIQFGLDPFRNLELGIDLALARTLALTLDITCNRNIAIDLNLALALSIGIETAHGFARYLTSDPALTQLLQVLHRQISLNSSSNRKYFRQWWIAKGTAWREALRAVMIQHRDIGYDWRFSPEEKNLMHQYHDANKLLVDCLNSDCYVSREVRQQIEEELLLPTSRSERSKN